MQKQQEAALIAAFRVMTQDDREVLVAFAQASAFENPSTQPLLRVIIGGRGSA
jgi:hypothetical protein